MAGNLSDLDTSFTNQVRALINSAVRNYVGQKGQLRQLALRCNLNQATVSKLAYYETARPTWRTVIAVAEELGLLEDIGKLMIAYGRQHRGPKLEDGVIPIRREKKK